MTNPKSFNFTYDDRADVLYITKALGISTRGVEDSYGIVWRYNGTELLGATIVDFQELWAHRRHDLAEQISKRFSMPIEPAEKVVEHALDLKH